MANWGVALANRPPGPPGRRKKHRHPPVITESPSLLAATTATSDAMQREPVFQGYGNVFSHICRPELGTHDCYTEGCERITINVSGLQFVTNRSVLERHPSTLLGDPAKRKPYYDHLTEEYFFDRHRTTFESIFNYYKYGGKLKRPASVTDDVFLDELDFFQVEEQVIKNYRKEEGYTETKYEYPDNEFLKKIWCLFEYPETSRMAFIIGIISVIATLVSIVTFTLETLPQFKVVCVEDLPDLPTNDTVEEMTTPFIDNMTYAARLISEEEVKGFDFLKMFFLIETICNIWFTIEALVRYISCPNKLTFWKDFKNIVDIMAVVPFYVALIQDMNPDVKCGAGNDFAFLRVIRLIRVFKLTKHSQGLQILLLTFQSSMEGLTLFVLTLMVSILMFSSLIYFCEIDEPDTQIKSIPGGFWWAVITMCTVGYGDVVPVGNYGKIVGTVCALSGVLTLAIPVPIITENFNKFYVHKQRSKPREVQKNTLLDKAHVQIVRLTTCCKEKANCNKDSDSDELAIGQTPNNI